MRFGRINMDRFAKFTLYCFAFYMAYFIFFKPPENILEEHAKSGQLWSTFYNYEANLYAANYRAYDIIKSNLEGEWKSMEFSDFKIQKLPGGFTNQVFKVSTLRGGKRLTALLKIEFPKSAEARNRELDIIEAMSVAKQGPKLLAAFPGGRIEEYIESRAITTKELAEPKFAFELGRKVSEMHYTPYNGKWKNEFIDIMRGFLSRIIDKGVLTLFIKSTLPLKNFPPKVTVGMLLQELSLLEKYMEHFENPILLIHNDIFTSNVLIQKAVEKKEGPEKAMMLIDYEFSMHGHRAADFVSYFTDFENGIIGSPERKITDRPEENHYSFCHGYLNRTYEKFPTKEALESQKLTGDLKKDTDLLLKEAQAHVVLNHLFWALENLVCHLEGNDQLDYEKYYKNRIAAYYSLKDF